MIVSHQSLQMPQQSPAFFVQLSALIQIHTSICVDTLIAAANCSGVRFIDPFETIR